MNDVPHKDWNAMSDDQIASQIGEFIRYHRMEQNKTQEMLAKDAGISRATLSLLERGRAITVTTLVQVLRVLDQLHVLNGFIIIRQQSPLLLAQAEKTKRQRASSAKKEKTEIEEVDW